MALFDAKSPRTACCIRRRPDGRTLVDDRKKVENEAQLSFARLRASKRKTLARHSSPFAHEGFYVVRKIHANVSQSEADFTGHIRFRTTLLGDENGAAISHPLSKENVFPHLTSRS